MLTSDGIPLMEGNSFDSFYSMRDFLPNSGATSSSFSTLSIGASERGHHPQPQPRQPKPEENGLKIRPLLSMTSERPTFTLADLEPDISFRVAVFAVNSKGRSNAVVLDEVTFKDPEKRTSSASDLAFTPLLGVAVGAVVALLPISFLIALKIKRAQRNKTSQREAKEIGNADPSREPIIATTAGETANALESKSLLAASLYVEEVGEQKIGSDFAVEQFVQQDAKMGQTNLLLDATVAQKIPLKERRSLSASDETMGHVTTTVPYPQGYATICKMSTRGVMKLEESEPDIIPTNFDPYSQGRPTLLLRNGSAIFNSTSITDTTTLSPIHQISQANSIFGSHTDMGTYNLQGPQTLVPGPVSWSENSASPSPAPSNTPPSSSPTSSACTATMRHATALPPSLLADARETVL